ncbi:hypothetical protein D3C83_41350 [compost metagenome]
MRSLDFVHGSSTLTVTLAAEPDSGRPSVCATTADGTVQFADSCPPGRLWNVPLNCTSIVGMV